MPDITGRNGKKRTGTRVKAPEKTMTPEDHTTTTVPMQDLLGQRLRAYYDQVANAPVPDRFEVLLRELEKSSRSKKNHRNDNDA